MIKSDSLDRRPTSEEISVLFEVVMRRPLAGSELANLMLGHELSIYNLIVDLINRSGYANRSTDISASSPLDQAITPDNLETLFNLLLLRPVGNEKFINDLVASGQTVHNVLHAIIKSPEFSARQAVDRTDKIDGATFRIPDHLVRTPLNPKRVLIIGSCAMDPFCGEVPSRYPNTHFARIVFNNAMPLPPLSTEDARGFDFQIVQLPIRSILPDQLYMKATASVDVMAEAFEISRKMLELNFSAATQYNRQHGLETFVYNFLIPQQNPLGRLQDRYSLSNPIFYIEELNRHLYGLIQVTANAYLIDVDQIASALGKRYIQDDSVYQLNHGSSISALPMPGDESRIEPLGDVEGMYSARVSNNSFTIYAEILAAYRSIRQHDTIKLVIFDLDDTLWRGVAAERAESVDAFMTEGWPMGILEACSFLWKRGILLAIVSKNDENIVKGVWNKLHEHNFPLAKFVATRINWKSKAENIADIIRLVNVRAESVLFVDDNPVERAHVKSAFPDIRVIDAPVAEWRRILLWSAEMQPAVITQEAIGRAVSIKGKEEREAQQASTSREVFLDELQLKIIPFIVVSNDHPRLARCLELINKTNQFNTTGKRWTEAEILDLFNSNGRILALQARDRFSNYGIIAVAIISNDTLLQYLMSCRVFGMEIEYATVALVSRLLKELGHHEINALTQPTGKNHLSLGLYSDLGFVSRTGGNWQRPLEPAIPVPSHVTVEDAAQL